MVVCRYLGDVLLATPLASSLQKAGYEVDWVVATGTDSILEGQPFAANVRTVDAKTPWREQFGLGIHVLRKYDIALALPSTDRSMLLALAASARVHALITADRSQEAWKRCIASVWADYNPGSHMVALACDLATASGLPVCRDVQIKWTDADAGEVFAALPWSSNDVYIHIHPFARWPYKWWKKSAWKHVISEAINNGLRVVISGSPAEVNAARDMATGFPEERVHVAAGQFNWRQLACLSHHAAAYIGLDTANTHLAAAAGANVIALFGPTDPRTWGPWPNGFSGASPWQTSSPQGIQRQDNISLLQGRQDCIPCQLEGCERRQDSVSLCLKEMQADWVWAEVEERIRLFYNKQANN